MSIESAIGIAQQTLYLSLILSAPLVLAVAIVGFLVSIFQAATQVQEPSIAVVAKTFTAYVVIMAVGLATMGQLVQYADQVFRSVSGIGR